MDNQKPKNPETRWIVILVAVIVVLVVGNGLLQKPEKLHVKSQETIAAKDPAEEARRKKELESVRIEDSTNKVKAKNEIEKLTANFIVEKDDFDNTVRYYHKAWGTTWPHRKTLCMVVFSDGSYYLISNYWNDSWIFHTRVQVKVGDEVYTSPTIESFSKLNIHEVVSGGIYERIIFTDAPDVVMPVAAAGDKTVKVRFEGGQYYDDAVLSDKDKKAISDCLDLANAIRMVNR